MYRCEAISEVAFVQQLACNLVNHGYWFYTIGTVPPGKDIHAIDQKLIAGYGIAQSKWQRARRKAKGEAKLSYLRHGRLFILIATEGTHIFKRREKVRDIRREPFLFGGYSIGCGKGSDGRYHASVKIEAETFAQVREHLLALATHRTADVLASEFAKLPFTPYARIRRQLLRLLREVNEARQAAGFATLPVSTLKLRRLPVKVFRALEDQQCEAAPPLPGGRARGVETSCLAGKQSLGVPNRLSNTAV